jgi:hypothetical protein
MRKVLHILTKTDDELSRTVISLQQDVAEIELNLIDLTVPEPDYDSLLEAIFDADSIEVW